MATKTKPSTKKKVATPLAKPATKATARELGNLVPLELKLIEPSKTNPRKTFDEAQLKELADSIAKHGVLQAILVRPMTNGKTGKYELVAGERRYRAAKLAGLKEIPSNVRTLDDKEVLEIQVIENLQRSDISPIEEAEGYGALVKQHGYSADVLASKIGKSASYVYKRMQLTALGADAREAFVLDKITLGHALLIARVGDESKQKEALKRAALYHYSPDSLKNYIEMELLTSLKSAPFSLTDPDLLPIAGACTACPHNTNTSKELFDDMKKPEHCSRPSCFNRKVTAWWQSEAEKAKEKGQEALSRSESEKIYKGYYYASDNAPNPEKGYVLASAKCPAHPEGHTWSKIVGDRLAPILALGQKNKKVLLYRTKDLQKLLKDEKWMKKDAIKSPGSSRPETDWRLENKIEQVTERRCYELINPEIAKLSLPEGLRLILSAVAESGSIEMSLENRGITNIAYDAKVVAFRKIVAEASQAELLFLLLETSDLDLQHNTLLIRLLNQAGTTFKEVRGQVAPVVEAEYRAAKDKPEPSTIAPVEEEEIDEAEADSDEDEVDLDDDPDEFDDDEFEDDEEDLY